VAFLRDQHEIQKIWPIIQQIRNHITDVFNNLELPVNLHTEKKGSPHPLVMTKMPKIHEENKRHFKKVSLHWKKLCVGSI
jgi:hypothetical protein